MSRFMLRRSINEDFSFCHIINFFVACQIMSLEEAHPLFKAWHSRGEDVIVDIPDEFDSRFRDTLDSLNFKYE